MEWFYAAEDGKRGPVSDGQLEELLRAGTISPATLVWHAGLVKWQPLREVWSLPVAKALCAECHREFAEDEMLQFEGLRVCAGCKPVLLQRVAEGGALPWPTDSLLRDERQLVMRAGAPLPDRCILCNTPANGYRVKRRFYLVGTVPRRIALELPMCPRHRRQRRWYLGLAALGVMVCGVVVLAAGSLGLGAFGAAFCLVGVLVGAAWFSVHVPVVEHVKTRDDFMWLKGVSPEWLEGLPEWRGDSK